jgi:hypothetical protein
MTIGTLVVVALLWFGLSRNHLGFGSVLVGLLAGLVFASTPMGAPIATAVKTSATSIGQSIQAGLNQAVK